MHNLIFQFAAESATDESTGLAALGIDYKSFLIQLVTFLFVFLILRQFVFKRVVSVLDNRQKTIEKGVNLTQEMQKQKVQFDKEVEEIRAQARKRAEQIVADGHAEAKSIVQKAETDAELKAEAIVDSAHKKIVEETAKARRGLEKEVVELVVQATETVTRQKLDSQKDNILISKAIKGEF